MNWGALEAEGSQKPDRVSTMQKEPCEQMGKSDRKTGLGSGRWFLVFLSLGLIALGVGRLLNAEGGEGLSRPVPSSGAAEVLEVKSEADGEVEALFKKGADAFARNEWDAASEQFEAVLVKNPKHLGAVMHLGWVAQRRKDWASMEKQMRAALRMGEPAVENAGVWIGLGFATLEQEKWEAATAAFAQAVALDPSNARARRFLALALGRRGWFQSAEEEMRRALQIEPDDAGAHFNLAVFYLQRQPAAIELARRHYYRALDLGASADPQVEGQFKDGEEEKPVRKKP